MCFSNRSSTSVFAQAIRNKLSLSGRNSRKAVKLRQEGVLRRQLEPENLFVHRSFHGTITLYTVSFFIRDLKE